MLQAVSFAAGGKTSKSQLLACSASHQCVDLDSQFIPIPFKIKNSQQQQSFSHNFEGGKLLQVALSNLNGTEKSVSLPYFLELMTAFTFNHRL
jgi:hypothetical protein